jgi:hypothetical protein
MNLTTSKIVICLLALSLALICIYIIASSLYSKPASFKDVGHFQQYLQDSYENPYFAKDIYIVPGQARLAHNVNTKTYDNSYLPYENAVPAIDVLRANQKNLPPSYYSQVIRHNIMP